MNTKGAERQEVVEADRRCDLTRCERQVVARIRVDTGWLWLCRFHAGLPTPSASQEGTP